VALGVPGRLRPWIVMTFGTTRVVGRQLNAPAALTPGEIVGTHFQRLRAHGFVGRNHGKKSPVTPPGIDPGTVRLVAQRLYNYATPGPTDCLYRQEMFLILIFARGSIDPRAMVRSEGVCY
jgi:hypothetical protein